MKTIPLIMMSLFFVVVTTNAQEDKDSDFKNPTRKGRFIGEVDFGFDSGNFTQKHDIYEGDVTTENSLFIVDTRIGYSFIDNLVVSLAIGHDHQRQETITPDLIDFPGTGSATLNKSNGGFIGLGAAYYFLKKQFKPFIGAAIGRTHVNVELEGQDNITELSGNGLGYTFDFGLAYFVNDHIGFEVRYLHASFSNDVTGEGTASGFAYDVAYEEDLNINIIEFGFIVAF